MEKLLPDKEKYHIRQAQGWALVYAKVHIQASDLISLAFGVAAICGLTAKSLPTK